MFPVLAPPVKDTAFPELAGHKSPISYVPNSAASPRGCLGKDDLPKDTAAPGCLGKEDPPKDTVSYIIHQYYSKKRMFTIVK